MKRIFSCFLLVILFMSCINVCVLNEAAGNGCDAIEQQFENSRKIKSRAIPRITKVTSITFAKLKNTLQVGEQQRIEVNIKYTGDKPARTDVKIHSKNNKIATIIDEGNNGFWIKTYKIGKVTIVAECLGKSKSKTLQVAPNIPVDSRFSSVLPIRVYPISKGKIIMYEELNQPFSTISYINGSKDECIIRAFYDNGWVKVSYPVKNGIKTAYCYLSDFIDPLHAVELYIAYVSKKTTTYRRSDLYESFGWVWVDQFFVVAEQGIACQIIYPVDSGGCKMGWIRKSQVKR